MWSDRRSSMREKELVQIFSYIIAKEKQFSLTCLPLLLLVACLAATACWADYHTTLYWICDLPTYYARQWWWSCRPFIIPSCVYRSCVVLRPRCLFAVSVVGPLLVVVLGASHRIIIIRRRDNKITLAEAAKGKKDNKIHSHSWTIVWMIGIINIYFEGERKKLYIT